MYIVYLYTMTVPHYNLFKQNLILCVKWIKFSKQKFFFYESSFSGYANSIRILLYCIF